MLSAVDYANLGRIARQQATEGDVKRICVHVCVYICMYVYICVHVYIHIYPLNLVLSALDYANLRRTARQQATEGEVKRICIHVCVYIYRYVYICVHVYIHIYSLNSVLSALDHANLRRTARQQATEGEVKRIYMYIYVYRYRYR